MKELYELRDKLCDELKEYNSKGINLDTVDKLAHAIKNLDKIIEFNEMEGYSGEYVRDYRMSRRGRKRDAMGRYSSRGYSYHGDMVDELRELMEDAPNEETKHEFKRFIQKIESSL